MTQQDVFGNFLGPVLHADTKAIQETSAKLELVTREDLADKLSQLRGMISRSIQHNNNNSNNKAGGA
jgi:hypothetical protein